MGLWALVSLDRDHPARCCDGTTPDTLLMLVVNVGLLSTLGYFAYTRKDQPWDRRIVGGAIAGTLALFSAEG